MIVTKENLYFPIGTVFRFTGRTNALHLVECVRVGYFAAASTGYQHAPDGQYIWILNDLLATFTDDKTTMG